MGKYRGSRSIQVNGRVYHIQDISDDSLLIICFVIALALVIWSKIVVTFHMPDEQDFASDRYREAAYEAVEKVMIDREKREWSARGFAEGYNTARNMAISGKQYYSSKDIAELTKYSKSGVYEVYTGVNVSLSATSRDGKTTHNKGTVSKDYIVTIKSAPTRNWYGTVNQNWKVIEIKKIKATTSEAGIAKMLNNWQVPEDKKPDCEKVQ